MLATAALREYLATRDISSDAASQLTYALTSLGRHLGRAPSVGDFTPETVNAWIAAEVERVSRRTARNYRASVLTLWRELYDRGTVDVPPLRVRKVKAPLPIVEAYEPEEIERLIVACDGLNPQLRLLFRAYILAAWYTCFRCGDLMRLRWIDIDDRTLVATITQHKTGVPIQRPIDKEAIAAIESTGAKNRKLAFGHALTRGTVWKIFQDVKAAAGISRGCPKWIRRSASTAIMLLHGEEAGGRALGHLTPGLARKHYFAAKHVLAQQLSSPRLRMPKGKRSRA